MKRHFFAIISFVIFVAFASAGCTLGSFKVDPEATSLEGILIEQGPTAKEPGTHFLDIDDSQIPVRSIQINLSSSQYLGNLVMLTGSYGEDEVFEATGISVVERLSEDSTVRAFTLYKNTDLGFQLKYYDDWTVDVDGDTAVFSAPTTDESSDVDVVTISQSPFTYETNVFDSEHISTPLSDYFAKNFPEVADFDGSLREIGPDRLESALMQNDDGSISYYLYRNGLIYTISFVPSAENHVDENESLFRQMLSEFRFIGFTVSDSGDIDEADRTDDSASVEDDAAYNFASSSDGLTSFESLPYSFRAGYPTDWYYAGSRSAEPGVLHHYGFSDESVTDENEIISLDLVSGDLPAGTPLGHGLNWVEVQNGSFIEIFIKVANQVYRFTAAPDHEGTLKAMAASVTSIEEVE